MSLDVYLTRSSPNKENKGCGIFVREGGGIKELTRAEWDDKFPFREPYIVYPTGGGEDREVYWANITHNLGDMADEAGIYKCLWRPDETGITKAAQLIEPLRAGLALLKSDPARFEKFNSSNGWGLYIHFVPFVEKYLRACEENPDADVSVSR